MVGASCQQDSSESKARERPPKPAPNPFSLKEQAIAASRPATDNEPPLDAHFTVTATLSATRIKDDVHILAADEMEGRGPNTEGIQKAAQHIEKRFREIGIPPAFKDSYRQSFDMAVATTFEKASNHFSCGKNRFRFGRDFEPFLFSASGQTTAPVAFAGFGIRSKKHGYDDYAKLDVSGKLVLVLSGEPGEDDPTSPFDGRRPTKHSALRNKALLAREAGARGLVVVKKKLAKLRTFSQVDSNAGLLSVKISPKAAKRILGFDPTDARKTIDKKLKPASRVIKGPPCKLLLAVTRIKRRVDNVASVLLPSKDTQEAVVLGAHYDHLGFGGNNSLSTAHVVHNGADDNASGTAAVIEIARAFKDSSEPLKRRVYFVLFAGEEHGLLGSSHFVRHPPVPIQSVAAMINLDMIGHLREQKLYVMGTHTGKGLKGLARRRVEARKLIGSYSGDGYGPSDHTSFYAKGVPVLFLFTGAHTHYHKPTDDPDTVNYAGAAVVAGVAHDLLRALASAQGRPAYVRMPAPKPSAGGGGYGPYFGSIPDFGEAAGGVLLSGVRAGSPADKAGVQKGDVIVRFNGMRVQNLQDFTHALRACAPGDRVEVVVQRQAKKIPLQATLQKRE